jgi:hypothetical protein
LKEVVAELTVENGLLKTAAAAGHVNSNELDFVTRSMKNHGRRASSRRTPRRIYKPRRDISVLPKYCYGRNLSRDKAVIGRMWA